MRAMSTGREPEDGAAKGRRPARRAPSPQERRRDPERTRARILEAAIEEFSAKGYAGARVSDIAARAGVNQQLIAYYFDGKQGLYREIGRRWRTYEAETIPGDLDLAELIKRYVRTSSDPLHGARLLAWEGLSDTGEDEEEGQERHARLQQEVEAIRVRQRAGEIDERFDPAALLLIGMSAASALAVYPQLARGLFGADADAPELVEHYAEQLARLLARSGPG
ncbi:MAG: TetR family transcriptional regulator [Streptosporangiales bacterium]|nr:TetR family transcriptional regulator [Streptosporangiales bacterium]